MKIMSFLSIFISMICLFLLSACERSDIQSTTNQADSTKPITNRDIDDCEDCPIDYCCCGIQLLSGTEVTLTMCGVYTGAPSLLCSPTYTLPSGCSGANVSTYNSQILLNPTSMPKALFCVPVGYTFRIYNPANFSVQIRFTCQVNDVSPDYETITIAATSERFFTSDGDCFLEECV